MVLLFLLMMLAILWVNLLAIFLVSAGEGLLTFIDYKE
jgi:hypothetical protein